MNCQKSGLDTVGSSISIVDLLRNDDASIDDWSSILRSSIYRVFVGTIQEEPIQSLFRSLDLPDQDGKGGYVGDNAEDENYPEDKTANNHRM